MHSKSARHTEAVTGQVAGHKLAAPGRDTTAVALPHSNGHHHQPGATNIAHNSQGSSDIGPIWSERDSSGHGTQQARDLFMALQSCHDIYCRVLFCYILLKIRHLARL